MSSAIQSVKTSAMNENNELYVFSSSFYYIFYWFLFKNHYYMCAAIVTTIKASDQCFALLLNTIHECHLYDHQNDKFIEMLYFFVVVFMCHINREVSKQMKSFQVCIFVYNSRIINILFVCFFFPFCLQAQVDIMKESILAFILKQTSHCVGHI